MGLLDQGIAGNCAAMRTLLIALFALLASPAFAQGWEHYDNARFGYGIDIPPNFVGNGLSDNGDGQVFQESRKARALTVWGGQLMGDFETAVTADMGYARQDAWTIAEQTITPRWASFGAVKGSRMVRQRMILLCDGMSYAAFRAEFSVSDVTNMTPIIERLAQSLKGGSC
jgi:hypothetical protein